MHQTVERTCPDPKCSGDCPVTFTGPYPYPFADGLSHVILEDVLVRRCTRCGLEVPEIRALDQLQRAVVAAILARTSRMSSSEFRFLQEFLGFDNRKLASVLGVTPSTLSSWRAGSLRIGPVADRLVRLVVVRHCGIDGFHPSKLLGIEDNNFDVTPIRLAYVPKGTGQASGWIQASA